MLYLCSVPLSRRGTRAGNLDIDWLSSGLLDGIEPVVLAADPALRDVAVTATAPTAKPAANIPACTARDILWCKIIS